MRILRINSLKRNIKCTCQGLQKSISELLKNYVAFHDNICMSRFVGISVIDIIQGYPQRMRLQGRLEILLL